MGIRFNTIFLSLHVDSDTARLRLFEDARHGCGRHLIRSTKCDAECRAGCAGHIIHTRADVNRGKT